MALSLLHAPNAWAQDLGLSWPPARDTWLLCLAVVLVAMLIGYGWARRLAAQRRRDQYLRLQQLLSLAEQQRALRPYFEHLSACLLQHYRAHRVILMPTPACDGQAAWLYPSVNPAEPLAFDELLAESQQSGGPLCWPTAAQRQGPCQTLLRQWRIRGLYADLLRDASGEPVGAWLLLSRHTLSSDRESLDLLREASEALSRACARAQNTANAADMLHALPGAIACTNAEGEILYLNPQAEALLKLPDWRQQTANLHQLLKLHEAHPAQAQGESVTHQVHYQIPHQGAERTLRAQVRQYAATPPGREHYLYCLEDVTDTQQYIEEIYYEATHDSLTGLENRRQFLRRLEQALEGAKQYANQHALCYIDLDHFKAVNDNAGHLAGDALLKQVASVISEGLRARDTLARMGGDEFALILYNCPMEKALQIAQKMTHNVAQLQFTWGESRFPISASIGITSIDSSSTSVLRLLEQADTACYQAKQAERGTVYCTGLASGERPGSVRNLASSLQRAIANNQFRLYAQPIQRIKPTSGALPHVPDPQHYEILLRMLDLDGQLVEPSQFVPEAERQGLMGDIDRWVIHYALEAIAELSSQSGGRRLEFGINLSGMSMGDEGLLSFVQEELSRHQLSHATICFEITETAAIHNMVNARHFIEQLRRHGCSFALDDFGSGMCSLRYLQQLPVDYLKIDGSFIREIHTNPTDRKLTAAIQQIGKVMHMKTIAEFVENTQILHELKVLGVDYAQGSLMGDAVPLNDLGARLPRQPH